MPTLATIGVLKLTHRVNGWDWQFVPVAGATLSNGGSAVCRQVAASRAGADRGRPDLPRRVGVPTHHQEGQRAVPDPQRSANVPNPSR